MAGMAPRKKTRGGGANGGGGRCLFVGAGGGTGKAPPARPPCLCPPHPAASALISAAFSLHTPGVRGRSCAWGKKAGTVVSKRKKAARVSHNARVHTVCSSGERADRCVLLKRSCVGSRMCVGRERAPEGVAVDAPEKMEVWREEEQKNPPHFPQPSPCRPPLLLPPPPPPPPSASAPARSPSTGAPCTAWMRTPW